MYLLGKRFLLHYTSSRSPRLPRRREATESELSIWHQALAKLLEPVGDDDEPLGCRVRLLRRYVHLPHDHPVPIGMEIGCR